MIKNPLTNIIPSLLFAREANPLGSSASVFALSSNSALFAVTILGVPVRPRAREDEEHDHIKLST